jgi:hypothetical protein
VQAEVLDELKNGAHGRHSLKDVNVDGAAKGCVVRGRRCPIVVLQLRYFGHGPCDHIVAAAGEPGETEAVTAVISAGIGEAYKVGAIRLPLCALYG